MAVSNHTIARLTRYRQVLQHYQQYNTDFIYSDEIASSLHLTAARVRKDLSILKISGRKKAGYPIQALLSAFDRILDSERPHTAVVVGSNPLGLALARDPLFSANKIRITAVFGDKPPAGSAAAKIPVRPLRALVAYVKQHRTGHAILAATDPGAQRAMDHILLSGIRSVLSLSPLELKVPQDCVVSRINLVHEFEKLVYYTHESRHP
ncbi:MAG: redox-sensing transcriptional repressor Rex [Fibrobacterota bacterium]